MTDVLKHLLAGAQQIPRAALDRGDVQARRDWVDRIIGQDAGTLIVARYPTTVSTDEEGNELRELRVYVFSPQEMAQLIADVRDKAIEETLATLDQLAQSIPEEENPDEQ